MNEHLIPGETVEDYENKGHQMVTIVGDSDFGPEMIIDRTEYNRQMMAVIDGKVYRWDNSNITGSEITDQGNGVIGYNVTITLSPSDEVKGEEK